MSAPRCSSLRTSSVSPLEQAARKTAPSSNFTLVFWRFTTGGSRSVSEPIQRFSCSFRFCFASAIFIPSPAAGSSYREGGKGEVEREERGGRGCVTVSMNAGQRRAGNREETLETSSIPQSTGAARPAERTSLPTPEALPPPARPPVTGGQSNVTSRDPDREAPFGQCACALGLCPPQEERSRELRRGRPGHRREAGVVQAARAAGAGTNLEGRRQGRKVVPPGSWGSGGQQLGCTVALPGRPASRAVWAPQSFALGGGFSYWLRYLNGMEDRTWIRRLWFSFWGTRMNLGMSVLIRSS